LFKTAGEALTNLNALSLVWTVPTTKECSGDGGDQGGVEMQTLRNHRESRHLSVAELMEKPSHFDLFFRCSSGSGIIA
jgi:hypothetical protein